MDHAEALELIELAAVEPDGLDRMMAGDTPESSAVAGHLAGCPACATELVRIRRTAMLARQVIAAQPDPALRERTLALVREVGRDRTAPGSVSAGGPAGSSAVPSPSGRAPAPDSPPGNGPAAVGRHRGDRGGADPRRRARLRGRHGPQSSGRAPGGGCGPPGDHRGDAAAPGRPRHGAGGARRRRTRAPRRAAIFSSPGQAESCWSSPPAWRRSSPATSTSAGSRQTVSGDAWGRCTQAEICSPGRAPSTASPTCRRTRCSGSRWCLMARSPGPLS